MSAKDTDFIDRSQTSALGDHFRKVDEGKVKPFDKAAFERNRIPRMSLTPEDIAALAPKPAQK